MAGWIESKPVDLRLAVYPMPVFWSAKQVMMRPLERRKVAYIFCVSLLLLGTVCSSVGPKALRGGRQAYTEAIAVTNDQQILGFIVRLRYIEALPSADDAGRLPGHDRLARGPRGQSLPDSPQT